MCNSLNEVFFAVEEEQKGRNHINCCNGKSYSDFAGIYLGKIYGKRLLGRIRKKDDRLFNHIPVIYKNKHCDGIKGAFALGKTDPCENLPFARAVKFCRFNKGRGNPAH